MKNKTFLGLPILEISPNSRSFMKHNLSIILSTALSYIIVIMSFGLYKNDTWKYFQSEERYYILTLISLFIALLLGNLLRALANTYFVTFYHLPKWDKWFYPIGFILSYLIINEIWGL